MLDNIPMTADHVHHLVPSIAASDPWRRLGIEQTSIARILTAELSDHMQRAITRNGEPIGAIVARSNWLLGPYLKQLSIEEDAHSADAGSFAIDWLVDLAQQNNQLNIWLCVSQFNDRAQRFYSSNGFEVSAVLDDLIVAGENETLTRRRHVSQSSVADR
jgi:ribosomal-protein-alanine N-acetyltransferase